MYAEFSIQSPCKKKKFPPYRSLLYLDTDDTLIGAADGDIWLCEIPKKEADTLVKKYHYSHKATTNSFVSFSVCGGKGVLQLGYGIRPRNKGFLSGVLTKGNYAEFDRMWLDDSLPKFSESRVIGLLIFYIKHKFPGIHYIVTYADESAGNTGTIYRATNAIELPSKEVDFYLLPNGERIHPVTMWHRHKTRAFTFLQKVYPGIIRIRGNVVQGTDDEKMIKSLKGKRQRKYIYALNRKAKQKLYLELSSEMKERE